MMLFPAKARDLRINPTICALQESWLMTRFAGLSG
jgi:hypothetical protein